jgi:hypothetical protein
MTTLNQDEKNLLNSIENEEWISIDSLEENKQKYQKYARYQVNQGTIEVILSPEDQEKLLELANDLGESTSSLTEYILHKYLQGELIEKTV